MIPEGVKIIKEVYMKDYDPDYYFLRRTIYQTNKFGRVVKHLDYPDKITTFSFTAPGRFKLQVDYFQDASVKEADLHYKPVIGGPISREWHLDEEIENLTLCKKMVEFANEMHKEDEILFPLKKWDKKTLTEAGYDFTLRNSNDDGGSE